MMISQRAQIATKIYNINSPEQKMGKNHTNHTMSNGISNGISSGQEVDIPPKDQEKVEDLLLRLPFKPFAIVTVSLPLFSMLFCFVTAVIFQYDQVNLTVCKVQNFIPSISAVTGVSPQRYVWRICIALHSTPRFAVGIMYYNMYKKDIHNIDPRHHKLYRFLLKLNFMLYMIENACLIGVTYISNTDNYPVHEMIFVVFMVSSLCYMLLTSIIYQWSKGPLEKWTHLEKFSCKCKWYLWIGIMSCTAALLFFFYKHRVLCEPGALSKFAVFEYIIVVMNIGYHGTLYVDFGDQTIVSAPNPAFKEKHR
ncbi:post-GPI attachment to proteins factor 2-like isoform X2 [Lineus longissimus]|uniref:post-GPI attachment to proteins factor 2-like isoform X2 n=1 Tax=Lineus longissimus TaxID=88925 RepID=UPI00315CBE8B